MTDVLKLLVPVDFSECSRAALREAAWIAGLHPTEVVLLHAWEPSAFLPPDTVAAAPAALLAFDDLTREHAQRALAECVGLLAARGVGVKAARNEPGRPAQVIANVARDERSDLIVMGTHGRSGLEHAIIGSVTERVLRRAPCPVLSYRAAPGAAEKPIRRVLLAVDYSDGSLAALRWGAEFATWLSAEIEIVHAWDQPSWIDDSMLVRHAGAEQSLAQLVHDNAQQEFEQFMARYAAEAGKRPPHRLISGDPARAVLDELGRGEYDLLVVGTQGRGGLQRLLLGSTAEKLVRLAPVPVVTVPPAVARIYKELERSDSAAASAELERNSRSEARISV